MPTWPPLRSVPPVSLWRRSAPPPHSYPPPRPAAPLSTADWLRSPRPEAGPGIWRRGHRPRDETPLAWLVAVALATASAGTLLCGLLWTERLGYLWLVPVEWAMDWDRSWIRISLAYAYYALILAIVLVVCARVGRWGDLLRRLRAAQKAHTPQPPPSPDTDPARWPELRAAGAATAADRLTAELASGSLSDVDHARITHAWQARDPHHPGHAAAFVQEVTARGAGAFPHSSGARDLPARSAEHDLLLRQVRIGTAVDTAANPYALRTAGIALDPGVLAASALAVGPSGAGKTGELVRPVTESLCLQALACQASVVLVTSDTDAPLPDDAFDVVVRPGDPRSPYSLDLYGTDDPDAAAGDLADALLGNLAMPPGSGDGNRAATMLLARLNAPFARVHGRLPGLAELRELLDGDDAVHELRTALADMADGGAYDTACLRGLDTLLAGHPTGPGDCRTLLADNVALLDRPAFAGCFTPHEDRHAPPRHPVSLRALDQPVRIRIDLPERRHPAASRVLARLLLGQFTRSAAACHDQNVFAFLILDDAAQAVTVRTLEGLRRLRSAHAGALLTLRSLTDDVPWHLRRPLLDAVGCRIACARLSPLDARHFTEVWHADYTTDAGTARRWTEYELTTAAPPGYAVFSCTTVPGGRTQPLLIGLGR